MADLNDRQKGMKKHLSDGQRFADHISFQNGKLSRSDEQRMKVLYKGAKPIAWKSLPEPYKGEQE